MFGIVLNCVRSTSATDNADACNIDCADAANTRALTIHIQIIRILPIMTTLVMLICTCVHRVAVTYLK